MFKYCNEHEVMIIIVFLVTGDFCRFCTSSKADILPDSLVAEYYVYVVLCGKTHALSMFCGYYGDRVTSSPMRINGAQK